MNEHMSLFHRKAVQTFIHLFVLFEDSPRLQPKVFVIPAIKPLVLYLYVFAIEILFALIAFF